MRFLLGAAKAVESLRPQAEIVEAQCSRYFTSGCTLCIDACPKDAISPTDMSVTIDDSCHGCGICTAVCPVDAIVGVSSSSRALAAVLESERRLQCDLAREIDRSCPDASVPCLGAVDPELLAAHAMDSDVELTSGPCQSCPIGSGGVVNETINRARAIVDLSGGTGTISHTLASYRDGDAERRRPALGLSRRTIFATDAAIKNSRQKLLEAAPLPALPQVSASEGCTACGACSKVCPVDAVVMRGDSLVFRPAVCVGCGECVRVCPEDVLALDLVGEGRFPRRITTLPTGACSRCEGTLGPGESGQCHRCTTRLDLGSGIWGHLGPSTS